MDKFDKDVTETENTKTSHGKGGVSLYNKREDITKVQSILILCVVTIIALTVAGFSLRIEDPTKLQKSESSLYVSEYMSKNTHYYADDMSTHDWVEIYNPSNEKINLSGYKLSNGKKHYRLNGEIDKNGYKVIYLDSSTFTLDHDEEGEVFYLKDKANGLVDLVNTIKVPKNDSVVRSIDSDGTVKEKIMKKATPGFSNNKKGLEKYIESRQQENTTGLVFNEVMASNKNTYTDEFGDTVDYIELINTGEKTLDISGYGLSDDESDVLDFTFPAGTKLKAGEVILVNCSSGYKDKDEAGNKTVKESSKGAFFACFGLKNGKEKVVLSNPSAKIIEKLSLDVANSDQSISRNRDGSYSATYYISPGYPNDDEGVAAFNSTLTNDTDMKNIHISEVMTKNNAYAPYKDAYYDWVEIYNPTDKKINLKGYSLTDSRKKTRKFVFGDTSVAAGEYLLVYCTDKKIGALSTGFNLNGGCAIYFYSPEKKLIDKVTLGELVTNVSKGRNTKNTQWLYYSAPTPGKANKGGRNSIYMPPVASKKSGQYNGIESLKVSLSGGGTIYYTTDGSVPGKSSKKYTKPLNLTKTTVIRAVCIGDDAVRSSIATYSYIINENHKMDVVMVSGNPAGFFSQSSGIFETGSHASSEFPYLGANFWQDWKRPATLELLPYSDKEEGFCIDGEASIFGGYSRGYSKKSFKFKFRDVYGSGKLNYDLFENRDFTEFDSLVLRASGQDAFKCMMKDDLTTSIADDVIDVMASRPVAVYINGEYFGIYYIREKINADFIASHYNVSAKSVDLLQGNSIVKEGDPSDYRELLNYVKTHDLSKDSCYKYVTDRMDVRNYADYIICETWCGNTDQGNVRCFRSSELDNKWRWIFYDVDMGFQRSAVNSFFELINPEGTGAGNMFTTALIRGLLQNKKFRALFIERLEYQMKNVWTEERVIKAIDDLASVIGTEVKRNNKRWNVSYDWQAGVADMKKFAAERKQVLRKEFAQSTEVRKQIALTDKELERCFGK